MSSACAETTCPYPGYMPYNDGRVCVVRSTSIFADEQLMILLRSTLLKSPHGLRKSSLKIASTLELETFDNVVHRFCACHTHRYGDTKTGNRSVTRILLTMSMALETAFFCGRQPLLPFRVNTWCRFEKRSSSETWMLLFTQPWHELSECLFVTLMSSECAPQMVFEQISSGRNVI